VGGLGLVLSLFLMLLAACGEGGEGFEYERLA
jgi:hypothetical protein